MISKSTSISIYFGTTRGETEPICHFPPATIAPRGSEATLKTMDKYIINIQ